MKKVFLLIFICSAITNVFAQSAKTRRRAPKALTPPILLRADLYPDSATLNDEEAVKRILDPFALSRKEAPALIAYGWMIDEDITLPAGALYKEFIRLSSDEAGRIVRYYTNASVTLKKNSKSKNEDIPAILSASVEYIDCAIRVEKNIVILTAQKNQEIEKFKVFLDKKKKKILKIQNMKTNKIYMPSESDETIVPSIGL